MTTLLRPISQDMQLILADIQSRHPDLDAARTGSLINTIAGVAVTVKRDAERLAIREFSRAFFASAQGEDLDRLADDHLQLPRQAASTSLGFVTAYRSSAVGANTIPGGTILIDADGREFEVTEATLVTGTAASVPVASSGTGRGANRPANTVLYPKVAGAPWTTGFPGLRLIAVEGMTGGNPVETDEEFRARIAEFYISARRATIPALRYIALTVPQVRRVVVDESRIRPERGGWVTVYVTDGSDQANQLMAREVQRVLDRNGKAAGVIVNVYPAAVVQVPVTVRMTQRAGGDPRAIQRALDAGARFMGALPIGADLYREALSASLLGADASILSAEIVTPTVNIIAGAGQLLRLPPEGITLA